MMSDASWDGEGVMLTSSTSSLSPKKEGGSRGKGRGFRKLSTPGKAPDDQPTPHQQKIIAFRRRLRIHIGTSSGVPDPLPTFSSLLPHLPPPSRSLYTAKVLPNIEAGKWGNPTPVQMQVVPTIVKGKDVMVQAPTGTGKTGAYGIGLIAVLLNGSQDCICNDKDDPAERASRARGKTKVRSVVMSPTRELCGQIKRELCRLANGTGLNAVLLNKENSHLAKTDGWMEKSGGIDVLVGTTGRVREVRDFVDWSRCEFVIIDEADRLMGDDDGGRGRVGKGGKEREEIEGEEAVNNRSFVRQLDSVLQVIPKSAVRGLFSATMGSGVRELASTIMRDEARIVVGDGSSGAAAANGDVEQELCFVGKEEGKVMKVRQMIAEGFKPGCIVFVGDKRRARNLWEEVRVELEVGRVEYLSSEMKGGERDRVVEGFREGKIWILICTDVAGRGMDFKNARTVVNFDFPESAVDYVHRIGRTGRGGRKGTATTLFTEDDFGRVREIANIIKQSGGEVEDWMLKIKKGRKDDKRNNKRRKDINSTPVSMRRKKGSKGGGKNDR